MRHFGILFSLLVGAMLVACDAQTVDPVNENILSEEEVGGLQFMHEEEKLARDVYINLFGEYPDLFVFNNISKSEQYHMDAILELMLKYDVEVLTSDEEGVFTNSDLQQLYDELIIIGHKSEIDALTVGAMIEDVDMVDLQHEINLAEKTDIIQTYEMLLCGSRNHLRAFVKNLGLQGEDYEAVYSTQEQIDVILDGEHESCGTQ